MATVMNPQHMHVGEVRQADQKVCIGMGIAFLIIGFTGVLLPGVMGLHLSMAHNLIHILSGAIAIWSGLSSENRAYKFCLIFGTTYGLLGVIGFMMGEPGYPAVGHMEADQNLFRIIPNVLELGTMDHVVHLFISAIFLFTAFVHRKDRQGFTRVDFKNSRFKPLDEINRRTTLGESDFNFKQDVERKI